MAISSSSDDEGDADIKKAIALSLECSGSSTNENNAKIKEESTASAEAVSAFRGLDRKVMEEQRLARTLARKRQRTISPPLATSRKAPRIEEKSIALPSGARLNMITSAESSNPAPKLTGTDTSSTSSLMVDKNDQPDKLKYPRGTVKYTWAYGHERTERDIKLEEVLEPLTLQIAVLSAFQWDLDWLCAKLRTPNKGGNTKCVFIMHAKEQSLRDQMLDDVKHLPFVRLCFPPMEGQTHCMHSKLMLLFHTHKLRIAIPSANLRDFDWGETGEMENSIFLIDLPRKSSNLRQIKEDLTPFGQELLYFLEKQTLSEDIIKGLLNFDFAATQKIAFVHSLGGTFYANDAERTGSPGLSRAVRGLGLCTSALEIDFAASSIGSLNDSQLKLLHSAGRGEDILTKAAESLNSARKNFFKTPSEHALSRKETPVRDQIRIYFPTYQTVISSKAGSAGTICLSRKWFENASFPKPIFRDYKSQRVGLLSHNKLLYARGFRSTDGEKKLTPVAWLYLGSANMSESAWGKISKDKKMSAWKITCRNWECGVLLPVEQFEKAPSTIVFANGEKTKTGEDSETESEDDLSVKADDLASAAREKREEDSETESENHVSGNSGESRAIANFAIQHNVDAMEMGVFDGILPPPFLYPGELYGEKEPWYFTEAMK